jgi:hypothetical protein
MTIMFSLRLPFALAAAFFAVSALPSQAQTPGPVHYRIENTSSFNEGCYDPCLCPIYFTAVPSGTFVLQFTGTDPAGYDNYDVTNVDIVADVGGIPRHAVGTGRYRRGGAVAVREQLILDLSANGAPFEHFDSGLVTPQAAFPRIEISVSINGMVCFDKVYNLVSEPNAAGVGYCFGDGSGTACPCGNAGAAGNGCASSVNALGANLTGIGKPSLSSDAVVLATTGSSNSPVLFFQGTQRRNGGAGAVFGDGLLCASGSIVRLKIAQAVAGEARIPDVNDPPLSSLGGVSAPGTYDYQTWYRDVPPFCTPATFNLSNGYEIQWTP